MVLQKGNEGARGQRGAPLAAGMAAAPRRRLTLIRESLRKATSNLADPRIGIIAVIALPLVRDGRVQCVVEVVIPLRGVGAGPAIRIAHEAMRFVAIVLQHQMNFTLATDALAH